MTMAEEKKIDLNDAGPELGREKIVSLIMSLRARGIRDTRVLAAIERVPRQEFVNEAFVRQAYADHALPIECGQTISQPYIVAYMTEQLAVGDRHKVLEIGTGSGYQTAVLSHLARRVYTIERYRTLAKDAEVRLAKLRISNVTSIIDDGTKGWPAQEPFDRIIVTAAAAEIPQALIEQLKTEGIMIIPVGETGGVQHIVKVRKLGKDLKFEKLHEVRFVPLVPGRAQQL